MAKKASSRKLSDLSIKRARPEAGEEVKGGRTKYTLGSQATLKASATRSSARRSRPD